MLGQSLFSLCAGFIFQGAADCLSWVPVSPDFQLGSASERHWWDISAREEKGGQVVQRWGGLEAQQRQQLFHESSSPHTGPPQCHRLRGTQSLGFSSNSYTYPWLSAVANPWVASPPPIRVSQLFMTCVTNLFPALNFFVSVCLVRPSLVHKPFLFSGWCDSKIG